MVLDRFGLVSMSGGSVVFPEVGGVRSSVPVKVVPSRVSFSDRNFYKESFVKRQVVLHHTVSDPFNSQADIDYWSSLDSRIATHFLLTCLIGVTVLLSVVMLMLRGVWFMFSC